MSKYDEKFGPGRWKQQPQPSGSGSAGMAPQQEAQQEAPGAATGGDSTYEGQIVDAAGLPQTAFAKIRDDLIVSTKAEDTTQLAERMGQRTKMHDPSALMALAKFVEEGDSHTKGIAGGKLELINNQIQLLQEQARQVLEDAKRDVDLSHAKCNFTRRPGSIYHLYKKKIAGSEVMEVFFSMLSPNEWSDMGMQAPDEYLDSYRLEWDMSWTPIAKIEQRDTSRQFDASILGLTDAQVDSNPDHLQLTLGGKSGQRISVVNA